MPLISFIIVNWNGCAFISSCIESILNQSFKNFEVIVVDNGSCDGSIEFIKKQYSKIKLIKLNKNYGFAKGNNLGFEKARGQYIALINNDVVLDHYWAEQMMKIISSSNNIGICSSKIIISNTDKIDSIGDRFTNAFTGTKMGENMSQKEFYQPLKLNGACAAAALYKRKMIEDVGLFHDIFFLNHEDTDLNMRAWLAGWKCYFVPSAIAFHDVNRSIGTLSCTSVYYFSRNNTWVWMINVPKFFLVRNILHRIVYEVFAAIYYCILNRQYIAYLKGKIDAFKYLRKIFKKRNKVQKKIRLSRKEIKRDLMSLEAYLFKRIKK